MKKVLFLFVFAGFTCVAVNAQQPVQKQKIETQNTKTKMKPNTTTGDKVHNVVHPKHKKAHGMKTKHKSPARKTKTETLKKSN